MRPGCSGIAGRYLENVNEESYVHRSLNPGVAQLGLRRRSLGKQVAITVLAKHTEYTNYTEHTINAIYTDGFLAGGFAGIYVDWRGKHAAVCGDRPSF